jgi:hypothetical protein
MNFIKKCPHFNFNYILFKFVIQNDELFFI